MKKLQHLPERLVTVLQFKTGLSKHYYIYYYCGTAKLYYPANNIGHIGQHILVCGVK